MCMPKTIYILTMCIITQRCLYFISTTITNVYSSSIIIFWQITITCDSVGLSLSIFIIVKLCCCRTLSCHGDGMSRNVFNSIDCSLGCYGCCSIITSNYSIPINRCYGFIVGSKSVGRFIIVRKEHIWSIMTRSNGNRTSCFFICKYCLNIEPVKSTLARTFT